MKILWKAIVGALIAAALALGVASAAAATTHVGAATAIEYGVQAAR